MNTVLARTFLLLLVASSIRASIAETLRQELETADVSMTPFSSAELNETITSYAASNNRQLFLLAYYVDDGSHLLRPPLHLIRYEHATHNLRRTELKDVSARFQGEVPMDCMGSALDVSEIAGTVYVDTHYNPSAGCLIVFSSKLELKTALSGWLLAAMGRDYAIFRESEVHFMSVHPLHVSVFDLRHNESTRVYPFSDDPQRSRFSRLIESNISKGWCAEQNAECDPNDFDADVRGRVVVNETEKVFGFQATFDADGFSETSGKTTPPLAITYLFRNRSGKWEHREFAQKELENLLGGKGFEQQVSSDPNIFFQSR